MAKYRDYYMKREATVGDSDTVIIDIGIKDPISYFTVEYEATNGATSCIDHELHDDISCIELVDGSDVIASLDMKQWRALNFFENGRLPHAKLSENADAVQEERCNLQFGRFKDDLEFYLDPNNYRNLQLRLTHALTVSATAGFATGTGKVTVIARVIEEGAKAYKGYLMAKELYNFTSADSGDEVIDMPRDYPYRALLVSGLLTKIQPDVVISKIKLGCDADHHIEFNDYVEDIYDMNQQRFGLAQQVKDALTADDGTVLFDLYDIRKAHIYCQTDDQIATIESITAEEVQNGLYDMTTPGTPSLQTDAKVCTIDVDGLCPSAFVCIPFGDMKEEEGWFHAETFGDIKLSLTQGDANADCSVVLQQLRI